MKIHYELMLTIYIQTSNKNIEWGNYNATEKHENNTGALDAAAGVYMMTVLERKSSINRSEIAERTVGEFCGEGMLRLDLLFFDYLSERFVAVFAFV